MSSLPSVTHGSAPRNPALAWFEAEPLDAWWSLMLGRLHGSIRAQGCPPSPAPVLLGQIPTALEYP